MISFWEREHWLNSFDFLVVGAGFTGLFSALWLREKYPDAAICIAERGALPQGASTKNAGFACFGSVGEILDDAQDEGLESALQRVVHRYRGLQKLRGTMPNSAMHFEPTGGHELFLPSEAAHYQDCIAAIPEINAYLNREIGFAPYQAVSAQSFGFKNIKKAIKIEGEGTLHPAKAVDFLLKKCVDKGIKVFFGLKISALHPHENGVDIEIGLDTFSVSKVLVATNAFAKNLIPELDIVPGRGQVLITKPLTKLPFEGTFHMDKGYYYFRNVGNRVLLGGARNLAFEAERSTEIELNQKIQDHLTEVLQNTILPDQNVEIESRWSGVMAFGSGGSKSPIVKQVSKNVVVAARLGGMGVALSANVATDAVALL